MKPSIWPLIWGSLIYIIAIYFSIQNIRKWKGYSLAWMPLIMSSVCLLCFIAIIIENYVM